MHSLHLLLSLSFSLLLTTAACGHDGGPPEDENELITTVSLSFTPSAGGDPLIFAFNDEDGDGGDAPVIDTIELSAADYSVAVRFENRLEDPPEDITEEVADEASEHQIFFTGSAIDGPATDNPGAPLAHAYDDEDANGHAIGLSNSMTAIAGTGELTLTLRHLPPLGGTPQKISTLAEEVRAGGFAAIGGTSDVSVTFPVEVP